LINNRIAVIAGEQSFGKGKIQAVFGLADGTGMTMTVAQYVTPSGAVIQSKGIKPDIPVKLLNPYVSLLADSIVQQKPDIHFLDFAQVESVRKTCNRAL
jgi:carboxyl-terminal processing protease